MEEARANGEAIGGMTVEKDDNHVRHRFETLYAGDAILHLKI